MDDGQGVGAEQTRQVGRRRHLRAHLVLRDELALAAVCRLLQPGHLVWLRRHRKHSGALPVDIEPQPRNIGLHAIEVLAPHRLECFDLVGPARLSVRQAMGQTGVDEAAVATRRRPSDAFGVDQNDLLLRVALCGMQCRPQTCIASTHHQQVCGDRTRNRFVSGPRYVQPHRVERARRERLLDERWIDVGIEHRLHTATLRGGHRNRR